MFPQESDGAVFGVDRYVIPSVFGAGAAARQEAAQSDETYRESWSVSRLNRGQSA